ncbi:hypothetical protein G7046_g707 [Stylonectria norvegica]|nr:hypothetical protein G7046_g707 [Stylonectria norvegica]
MSTEVNDVPRARAACIPCRKSKRRCDKLLPSCHLCNRKDLDCSYPSRRAGSHGLTGQTPSTASPDGFIQSGDREAIRSPFEGSGAKALYFIAPHIFQEARLDLPKLSIPIPNAVFPLLGDISSIRNTAMAFFTSVHHWLPIISKRDFFSYILNPLSQRQTELNQTCIGKLRRSTTRPTNGNLCIHTLQAGILIACYELGHAIYPAAYLTVGGCARYGLALGIDRLCLEAGGVGDALRSWQEIEERRRAWWAVLIFDRFLSLGNPTRPLSTEDPTFDTYLPVDDTKWDNHQIGPEDAVKMSNGFTLKMGSFARLAQTTYLLSQALRSISPRSVVDEATQDDQTAQLRRTLLALVHAADSEAEIRRLEYCAQSALSLSTIFLLQDTKLQDEGLDDNHKHGKLLLESLWYETRTGLHRLTSAAAEYNQNCPDNPVAAERLPIFLIVAMYQVACMHSRVAQGMQLGDINDKMDTIWALLRLMSSRWRLAGIYLNILEAREMTMSTGNTSTVLSS